MAYRVVDSDVRAIIESDQDLSMLPYIASANALTNKVAANDTTGILSTGYLKLIEQWLAAHYYATTDPGYQSKSTGGASASFQGQTAMFLKATYWGQRAIELDASGYLANWQSILEKGGKQTIGVTWLGKPPSTQVPYVDRN